MSGCERRVLSGIAASSGVAVGKVCLFDRGHVYVPRRYVAMGETAREEQRLHSAVEASRQQLEDIRARVGANPEHGLLLEAQLLMHRDELLIDGAVELIRERRINAEWALAQVTQRIAGRMRTASEPYFRARASDVENLGDRILHQLTGTEVTLPEVGPDTIIVADDLGPADALQLLRSCACGVAIDVGSASSHTAILARALDIPAVVGVRGLAREATDDDVIIVDAFKGEVILGPSEEEQLRARERGERYRQFTRGLRSHASQRSATRDGHEVRLFANVELPPEAALALQEGASGIGLYRTEFLYLDRMELPSEEEQARVYTDVAQVLAPRPVVFRTFDIGGDKLHDSLSPDDCPNPALGMRAIRLALAAPALLLTQLRAIWRASAVGEVRIMFPMVSGVEELRCAKALLEEARTQLLAEQVPIGTVKVGCMIEVPAAVLMADELASECEFFSVGTNDLVQYTLAVDRSNPAVAHFASPLHPAVLRLVNMTVAASRRASIELAMCGGMAADLKGLPLVLGAGFRQLSVDLSALPLVRAAVGRIEVPKAERAFADALQLDCSDAVRSLVEERFGPELSDLWAENAGMAAPSAALP